MFKSVPSFTSSPLNHLVERVNLNDSAFLYAQSSIVPILLRYGCLSGIRFIMDQGAQGNQRNKRSQDYE